MNKPENPEEFTRAEGLFKRAADAGGRALQTAKGAGENAWRRAAGDPDDPSHRRRVLTMLGIGIVAVIAVMFVLSRLGGDGAVHTPVSTAQAVSVITTAERPFHATISLNGEARPVRDIQVSAPATGVRILQLLVDEGEYVREGQPMARLDTNLAQAQTRAAQASVAEAESTSVRARGEYERAESIRDSGALSTEAIETRRSAAIAADARLAAARAQLQEVNARLGGGYVRAPAAGLVIDRTAEVGRDVAGQILFRIAAGNDLEVAAQVAEGEALALTQGQTATFSLVDGTTVEGRLRRLPASIDSRTRTGEALFQLPRETRVRAGMYLRGEAQLAERSVLAVPQSSILYDNGQAYVFVLDQENNVHRTNIALGARDGDWVEIVSGLELNQRIVGAGAAFLQDGDEVRPLADPTPAATTAPADQSGENNSGELRGREG
ncbi:efflux RND transporter periplasmic adaptor subunit [Terricaulis silvestris]|uniref:Macrolide-specific efflux protein MacA n=1 Tax=Terricaulis silvestris TaxID=2686094 RepID=A0A6I6MP45_9CAUL|nr:efflux RND transporter periplasmic adaptor subunit [Terricaulis silvestris]QGZ93322.1 Macrolide-specific efflux protein MacA precursor [Terricaulis silvestris]